MGIVICSRAVKKEKRWETDMSDRTLLELESFFLTLSDGTRLRLLSLMRHGEVSVGYLSEQLGQSQPKISRHLAYLRSAGLVDTRRDGKWIYYHIAYPKTHLAARLLENALDWVSGPSPTSEHVAYQADEAQINYVDGEESSDAATGRGWNEIEIHLL